MATFNRRTFLRFSAMSAPFAMFSSRLSAHARKFAANEKLLIIFGRGGNDSLNTFVPHGDPGYVKYRTVSGSGGSDINLFPAGSSTNPLRTSLPLPGTTYFEAHPALGRLTQLLVGGRAAILGGIGNPECLRSHFHEMRIIESGVPRSIRIDIEGWGARLAENLPASNLKGVTHTIRGQQVLFSRNPAARIATAPNLFANSPPENLNFDWGNPSSKQAQNLEGDVAQPLPRGWRGHLDQVRTYTKPEFDLAYESARSYFDFRDELGQLPPFTHDAAAFPRTLAEATTALLPPSNAGYAFMDAMEEAMFVLKESSASICGVDLASFDTHDNQLAEQHALLAYLSHALFQADLIAQADATTNYTILFITEFGRTIKSNGNDGTDHGIATSWIAVGDRVRSGLYNMTPPGAALNGYGAHWKLLSDYVDPAVPSVTRNAVPVLTDFRTVIAEIMRDKFLMPDATIDSILGGQPFMAQYGSGADVAPLTMPLNFIV